MKLLFCPQCWDVIKLDFELRKCSCGNAAGKYLDKSNAVVNGNGYSLAIDNNDLVRLLFQNPNAVKRTTMTCWARSHDGDENPHTKIDPELGKETDR